MDTLKRLNAYSVALEKWAAKKNRYDLAIEAGRPEKKPLESEPMPNSPEFCIGTSEMAWAEKIRAKITTPKPAMPTLDSQLPKIKMPVRKIV